jgi:uncharacterized protein involved in exopolysaccharide biosynthesis/Mrp family chromosome partitioning ATPase
VDAVRRILNCLHRRRRLIFYTIGIGGVLLLLASIVFQPSYLATAQLILDLHQPDVTNTGAPGVTTVISPNVEDSAIDTHITTLVSDANLRRALQALGALDNGDVGEADREATIAENATLTRLRRGLKVGQERRSRIISVGYNDTDPGKAAQTANAVAQVYVDSLRREKRDNAELAVTRFTHRLADLQDEVARAENEVHVYRQSHAANEATDPDQTEQQITRMARQLALLKTSATSAQQRLDDFHNLRSRGQSMLELAKVLDSTRLAELADVAAGKLLARPDTANTPLPDLLRAIDNETAASISRLEMEQRTYQSQTESIESRLALLRRAATKATEDTIGLRELERKAAALGQLYETLLRQRQDLIERSKLAEPDIRILALAEAPPHPTTLRRVFLIPPALIALVLLGSMIALTLDRLDHTLHGERETAEALQIPCAGLVPGLTLHEARSIPHLLNDHPGAPYSKAIRSIFAATVPLCRANPEHKVILITSSVPGEGKTNLAWSLVVSAARLQWNVLLLEIGRQASPLRSEALGSIAFPVPAATLSDVMARRSAVTSVVGSIPDSGISFLPLSSGSQDLLPLLANPGFPGLMEQIREAYDLVIIDAPSVFDSSEVRLLISKADKVLFAVRWGSTPRETAYSAVQLIQSHDSRNLGKIVSVVTKVDLRQHASYRFYDQGDSLIKASS